MASSSFAVTVRPATAVRGRVRPPGDKSISHRYALLAAIAEGNSRIHGYSTGADCASTLRCLRGLGVEITQIGHDPRRHGKRLAGQRQPALVWQELHRFEIAEDVLLRQSNSRLHHQMMAGLHPTLHGGNEAVRHDRVGPHRAAEGVARVSRFE